MAIFNLNETIDIIIEKREPGLVFDDLPVHTLHGSPYWRSISALISSHPLAVDEGVLHTVSSSTY